MGLVQGSLRGGSGAALERRRAERRRGQRPISGVLWRGPPRPLATPARGLSRRSSASLKKLRVSRQTIQGSTVWQAERDVRCRQMSVACVTISTPCLTPVPSLFYPCTTGVTCVACGNVIWAARNVGTATHVTPGRRNAPCASFLKIHLCRRCRRGRIDYQSNDADQACFLHLGGQ
jgi:hypothetical protein